VPPAQDPQDGAMPALAGDLTINNEQELTLTS
jgi:hypothetical protein